MSRAGQPTIAYVASTSAFLAIPQRPMLVHMARAGWRVLAVAPRDEFTARLDGPGIEYVPLPISRRIGAFASHAASARRLHHLYRRERPAIVHHFTANPVIYGSLAARAAGVPCVVNTLPGLGSLFSSRRWDAPFLRACVRTGYRVASRLGNGCVVFQNQADRDLLVRQRVVPPARAVVIPSGGIDLERFAPAPEPEGDPVLLLCARMLWSKGVGDLVEAARILRGRGVRCRVVLAGPLEHDHRDAIPARELERWAGEGIATWLGMRDDLPRLYAAAHIVVLPTHYGEGTPTVLVEAAASGRAVVASDIPGCREIVRDGRSGRLVRRGDVNDLADALAQLIANRELRQRMGREGRDIAVAEFGIDNLVARTEALYAELGGGSIASAAA